jgi:4-hydroxy-tetrahydrodipicolinate synthase
MAPLDLSGTLTALATPFSDTGTEIDWASYEKLLDAQLAGGVTGVVPCGTTGESPTLSESEQKEIVARTVRFVRGRARVVAGTGTNDTKRTIDSTRAAFDAGADAAMLVMPYYNRPSQEGLLRHVTLVAQAAPGPLVLYNIPSRSSVELSVETLLRILDLCPTVVALKDASGGLLYSQELLSRSAGRIAVLCGDDPLTLPMLTVSAQGVISVTSNLYPRAVADVIEDFSAGRSEAATAKHRALFPVHRVLFSEPNPAPVKAALAAKGLFTAATVRPPLADASPTCRARLADVMTAYEARA